jgi:hypothetical protein
VITRQWLHAWVAAVGADPENAHIGRFTVLTVRLVATSGTELVLHYDRGSVRLVEDGPAPQLELRGPASAWAELLDPQAAPRRHDLLSLLKAPKGLEVVSGREHLLRHLRVLTRLVEIGRDCG